MHSLTIVNYVGLIHLCLIRDVLNPRIPQVIACIRHQSSSFFLFMITTFRGHCSRSPRIKVPHNVLVRVFCQIPWIGVREEMESRKEQQELILSHSSNAAFQPYLSTIFNCQGIFYMRNLHVGPSSSLSFSDGFRHSNPIHLKITEHKNQGGQKYTFKLTHPQLEHHAFIW